MAKEFSDFSRSDLQLHNPNELIRSLQKQLEATEHELANEKWVFQQFLRSPSWRVTFPIRWIARQWRTLRSSITGVRESPRTRSIAHIPESASLVQPARTEARLDDVSTVKELFTSFYRVQLESFLNSKAVLHLPDSKQPEATVILVLFNRAELTLTCLRSISETCSEQLEIIIVDNASQDQTPLLLRQLRGARVIRNAENRNFLSAVNQAAHEARGEYLLLLNNDAQLLPATLQSAMKTIRNSPDIGAVGGKIILFDGTLQEAGSMVWHDGSCLGYGRGDNPFAPMYMFRRDVDYCSAAFLLTRRNVWERLGGFDEVFKPAYYEETDYCVRLWEQGLRVVYDPGAVLLHYEFASFGSMQSSTDLQRQHQEIFEERHRNFLSKQQGFDPDAILSARIRSGDKRRVLFIDDQVPHNWLGSGHPRAQTILKTLMKQGCFITFYPLCISEEAWSSVYFDMPQEIEFMMGYGLRLLEAFLRHRCGYYNTIFISRPHNMKIVKRLIDSHREWFEHTKIIYDAEAFFASRDVSLHSLNGKSLPKKEINHMFQEEAGLAAAADCVISVSEGEKAAFHKYGVENVHVLGHTIAAEPTPRPFVERRGFLFVGAIPEETSPNGDSMIWFLEEIFPRIQTVLGADIPLTIAGRNQSERLRKFAGPSVRITGPVIDLTGLYDAARVFIAPTRFAAGISHKVHEAAARGLPVVSTPLIASQLGWRDGELLLVGGEPNEFARQCIELHTNEKLWVKLREAALARVRAECSPEAFERKLGQIVER